MNEIRNDMYYQSNIKTSRDEDSVYVMKYANQQKLIDKLQEENETLKKNNQAMQEEMARTWAKLQQKEDIINKAKEYIKENTVGKKYGEEYYIDEFDRFASPNKLLEILDNKGE